MKKTITKITSIVLVLVTICSIFTITASAASTKAFDILTSSKYAKVYTLSSSGTTIPYTSKSLTTRGSVTYGASKSAYIDNKNDELRLMNVGVTNGKYWAYVSYPVGSGKRANAYIYLSAITGNNASHAKMVSSGKFYCSYRKGVSTSSSYYVAKNDTVYLIATSGSQYQIMYPISNGQWRIGWCSKSNYDKYCFDTPIESSSWQWPMTGYTVTQTFGNYYSARKMYHCGVDMSSSKKDIYAAADGVVVYRGGNASSGNGYHVVLSHNLNGTTVYSLYSHLSSYASCPSVGSSVSKGTKIGVMGNTGNSTGPHLHFAIFTKKSTDPYGYSYNPVKNYKTSRDGYTFYDPSYVINYGKLP